MIDVPFLVVISSLLLFFIVFFYLYMIRLYKYERKEVKEEVEKVFVEFEEPKRDVLFLMIRNVAELREYYIINKQQARNSFSAALLISILGFLLFSSGITVSYLYPEKGSLIPYSTVAGSVVEIIAGLFFWLYSKAIKQINIFHSSLQGTEKFLTAIELVERVSDEKRDDIYKEIISQIIGFKMDSDK